MALPYNTLILAPHIDDEVIGCFSFLRKGTFVHCFGAEDRNYISRKERIEELHTAAVKAGFDFEVSNHICQEYECNRLIGEIESKLNELKPQILLIPPSDYNQDHRAVHQAALAATRPHDSNWLVPNILIYEHPSTLTWPFEASIFSPNLFRPIDINSKVDLYQVYASQVKASPLA